MRRDYKNGYYAYYPLLSDFNDISGNNRHARKYEYVEFNDGLVCPNGVAGGAVCDMPFDQADNFSIELDVYKYTQDSEYPNFFDFLHARGKGFNFQLLGGLWYIGFSNQGFELFISINNSKIPRNTWITSYTSLKNKRELTVTLTQGSTIIFNETATSTQDIVLDQNTLYLGTCAYWAQTRGLVGRIKNAKIKIW